MADVWTFSQCRLVFDDYRFGVGCANRRDIDLYLESVCVYSLGNERGTDIKLHLLTHKRASSTTEFITNLSAGEFAAIAQKITTYSDVNILGKAVY